MRYPVTPDDRYFVVRGRLWRMGNPGLNPATREALVRDLMSARRAVRDAKDDPEAMRQARGRRIAYVPQEPMSNLDPSFTIGGPSLHVAYVRSPP